MNFSEFQSMDLNGSTSPKPYLFDRVDGIYVSIGEELAGKADRVAEVRKKNHKNHNKSDFHDNADQLGLYGECVFATHYNLEVDWSIKLRDKYDFKVGDTLIDVKATETNPYLTVKANRLKKEYVYVFCACRIKHADGKIVGWMSGAGVLSIGDYIDKYKGEEIPEPYYRVQYTSLHNMSCYNI